jgi:hypothetical protein
MSSYFWNLQGFKTLYFSLTNCLCDMSNYNHWIIWSVSWFLPWFTPAFWLAWYVHILAIAQKQQSVECKLLIPHHPHCSCPSNQIDWICGVTRDNNIVQIQSLISTLYRNSLTCEFLTSSQNSEKPIMGDEEIWDTLRFWLLYTNPEHELVQQMQPKTIFQTVSTIK